MLYSYKRLPEGEKTYEITKIHPFLGENTGFSIPRLYVLLSIYENTYNQTCINISLETISSINKRIAI